MEPVTTKVTPDAQPGSAKRPPPSMPAPPQDAADSSDSDDEGPSLETMKALGRYAPSHPSPTPTSLTLLSSKRQVQRAPTTSTSTAPAKIVIPKRGEKDFEPLNETVTIQEKMLRESRQALFDGLSGVRGTSRYVSLPPPFPTLFSVR